MLDNMEQQNFISQVSQTFHVKSDPDNNSDQPAEEESIHSGRAGKTIKKYENDKNKQCIRVVIPKAPSRQASSKKQYQCSICNAMFNQSWNCVSHMQSHTRIKPTLSCEICGKKCSKQSELAIHMRIHTGEKPFECPKCKRRFVRLGHLKEHMRCHTGEKPYMCSKCGMTFSCSSNMKRHLKIHEQNKQFSAKKRAHRQTANLSSICTRIPCTLYPILAPKSNHSDNQDDHMTANEISQNQEAVLCDSDVVVNVDDHTQRPLKTANHDCIQIVLDKDGAPTRTVSTGVKAGIPLQCNSAQRLKATSPESISEAQASASSTNAKNSSEVAHVHVVTIQGQGANESGAAITVMSDGQDASCPQIQNDGSNLLVLDWSFLLEEFNSNSQLTQASLVAQGLTTASASTPGVSPVHHTVSAVTLPLSVSDLHQSDMLKPITITIPHVQVSDYSLQQQEHNPAAGIDELAAASAAIETTSMPSLPAVSAVSSVLSASQQPCLAAQMLFFPESKQQEVQEISGPDTFSALAKYIVTGSGSSHKMVTVPVQQATVSAQQMTTPLQQTSVPVQQITQKDKPWQCDVCQLTFSRHWYLTVHRNAHFRQKSFSCNVCGATFPRVGNLNRHMRVHTGEKPFKCEVCLSTFSTKYRLGEHQRRHKGIKPFRCETCNGSFTDSSSLRRHQHTHKGDNLQHACKVCGAGFNTSHSLSFHMHVHNRDEEEGASSFEKGITLDEEEATARDMPIIPIEEAKPETPCVLKKTSKEGSVSFICSVCFKSFRFSAACRQHIMCHTGSRPFACKECGAKFSRKADTKRHMKIHLRANPHRCKECGNAFMSKSKLVLHAESHIDLSKRVHQCGQCMETFSCKTVLHIHQQTHLRGSHRKTVHNTSLQDKTQEEGIDKDCDASHCQTFEEGVDKDCDASHCHFEEGVNKDCDANHCKISEEGVDKDCHASRCQTFEKEVDKDCDASHRKTLEDHLDAETLYGKATTQAKKNGFKKELTEIHNENKAEDQLASSETCNLGRKETFSGAIVVNKSIRTPRREAARRQQVFMSAVIAELKRNLSSDNDIRHLTKRQSRKQKVLPSSLRKRLPKASKQYRCDQCKVEYTSKAWFLVHLRAHSEEHSLKCPQSLSTFSRKDRLRVNTGGKKRECRMCGLLFATRKNLHAHRLVHQAKSMNFQLQHHSRNIARYKCSKCDACFKSQMSLTQHLRSHNSDIQQLQKTRNSSIPSSSSKLQLSSQPKQCEKRLVEMQRRLELGEIAFRCHVCKLEVESKQALTTHLSVHPLCAQCGIAFHHACDLSTHMRTHTGEKPYTCHTCSLSFAKNSQLRLHQRKHSAEDAQL